jgi:WD40 repeat protein
VSDDRTVRLWQPTLGRMVRFVRLADTVPLAVRWMPDGQRVIVACTDGTLRAIDVETAAVVSAHPVIDGWAYSLAVHPDGQDAVAAGEDGQILRVRLP